MNLWQLPYAVELDGEEWAIRTDYRAIIDILTAISDPEYEDDEKFIIALTIFYIDFDDMPASLHSDAYNAMIDFIDMGNEEKSTSKAKLMDWEQDARYIIPAVNKVMGTEIRALDNLHWYTFMGAYMEIGEGAFSTIVSIRDKKAKGKKLEDWEREFYKENKASIDFAKKYTEDEKEEIERLNELFS